MAPAVGPEPGALQQHDQRHPVAGGDPGHPVALGVGGLADRAGLHGEVLGGDHDGPPVDPAGPHDHGVGRRLLAAHQRAQLLERSRVEQVGDAGPGVQLAAFPVLAQPLLAAHGPGGVPPAGQLVDDAVPALGAVGLDHRRP
jgi:hypothetical protein